MKLGFTNFFLCFFFVSSNLAPSWMIFMRPVAVFQEVVTSSKGISAFHWDEGRKSKNPHIIRRNMWKKSGDHQLIGIVYPMIYDGFDTSQVVFSADFWNINRLMHEAWVVVPGSSRYVKLVDGFKHGLFLTLFGEASHSN